jgi:hypothetical protein
MLSQGVGERQLSTKRTGKAKGRDHSGLALLLYRPQLCGTMMMRVVMMVNVMMSMRSECRSSRRNKNHGKKCEGDPLHSE